MSADDLFALADQSFRPFVESDDWKQEMLFDLDQANGCGESCEAFGPEFVQWDEVA